MRKTKLLLSIVICALLYMLRRWSTLTTPNVSTTDSTLFRDKIESENKELASSDDDEEPYKHQHSEQQKMDHPVVRVNVNYLKKFNGLKISNELYVPFSFLKNYYEISGEFVHENVDDNESDNTLQFLWLNVNRSMLDVKKLKFPIYSTTGAYLTFYDSDVPKRARVKYISGVHEVPVTTQWDPDGYFYPTQIAQYGLSYLSKFHHGKKPTPRRKMLQLPEGKSGGYKFSLSDSNLFTIKLEYKSAPVGFSVKVLASDNKKYTLTYKTDYTTIERSKTGNVVIHGIGLKPNGRKMIYRDLQVDLMKGLSFREGKKQGVTVGITIKRLVELDVSEIEKVSSIVLSELDHKAKFLSAADWFVNFIDENGGWSVGVRRVIFRGMEADSGWYSAMGQGQAISLLSRVYSLTKNKTYLNTALAATKVFNKLSAQHGVKAMLFDKLPWYEEYPTTPPSFVLNGFIYSLFGLYDLAKIAQSGTGEQNGEPLTLFHEGLKTLEKALPLFDNGHGSYYDLRHISIPGHEPNRARWQYHRIHLEQLSALIDITNNKKLKKTMDRWIGYASGILSRHN